MTIDVQRAAAPPCPATAQVRRWVRALFTAAAAPAADLTVRLVDEPEMRALNAAHRGRDYAANVLSFPGPEAGLLPPDHPLPLGDVVVCVPVARAEAQRFGKTDDDRLAHLVVHGVAHLLGHDHHTAAQRRRMEALERAALAALRLADPYLADTAPA